MRSPPIIVKVRQEEGGLLGLQNSVFLVPFDQFERLTKVIDSDEDMQRPLTFLQTETIVFIHLPCLL